MVFPELCFIVKLIIVHTICSMKSMYGCYSIPCCSFSIESNLQTVKIEIIVFNLWGSLNCDWDHSKGKKEEK